MFKSTDNGEIWADITRNFPSGVPVLALAVHPDSANVVYAGIGPVTNVGVQRLKQTGLGAVSSVTAGNTPGGLTVGDLNGDGIDDIVVGNSGENDLSVYLTASLGAVLGRTDFRAGSGPVATRAGDLDGLPTERVGRDEVLGQIVTDVDTLGVGHTKALGDGLESRGRRLRSTRAEIVRHDNPVESFSQLQGIDFGPLLRGTPVCNQPEPIRAS